jgi:DNA-binding NarL/FixJ family response regulator
VTRSTIGGTLDLQALAVLSGTHDSKRMEQFHTLSREQQAQAIRQLASSGMTDHGIAAACRLSVEMVRAILSQRPEQPGG